MRLWDLWLLFMQCSWTVAAKFDFSHFFQQISAHCALFTDPQISLFNYFFIKNGSHDTIHTFKNYFAIVFFSFQFSAVSKWTLSNRLGTTETQCVCISMFFFSLLRSMFQCFPMGPVHCSWDLQTYFSTKFLLKMGPTALFTHLKIILLQYFQFSVFSKISSIQTDSKCCLISAYSLLLL